MTLQKILHFAIYPKNQAVTAGEIYYNVTFNQFSLDSRVYKGIQQAGFEHPTPIQEQSIPLILQDRDILGLAQTGTGKTAAFIVPLLHKISQVSVDKNKKNNRKIKALVLAPTRELAEQIYQVCRELGYHTPVRGLAVYGGVNKNRQIEALRRGVDIVIACPGRLLDLHGDGAIDLSGVEYLVLDEADRMFDMGFIPDIRKILKIIPEKRQNLFFSATMPKEIDQLAQAVLKNPETVQIRMNTPAKTVSHALYPVSAELKKQLLFSVLEETATGRVLIFTRTKYKAKNLAGQLKKRGYRSAPLQGDMSQNRRQDSINGFRSGKYDILVATDIAARGIDISEISHVINFDMPDTVDAYTHRIGRTGRAKQDGDAFTFAVADDHAMLKSIEKALKEPIERRRLDGFDYGGFIPEELFPDSEGNRERIIGPKEGRRFRSFTHPIPETSEQCPVPAEKTSCKEKRLIFRRMIRLQLIILPVYPWLRENRSRGRCRQSLSSEYPPVSPEEYPLYHAVLPGGFL